MMNHVTLPALLGDSPLAILAAIGTLRLIHDFTDDNARLHWNTTDHRPVLTSSLATVDEVAEALVDIVRTMPEGVSVPGGPMGFPPPGEAPDKLRVPQGKLHSFAENLFPEISETESATMFSWLTSLITDLAATSEKSDSGSKNQKSNSQKRCSVSQFIASSGKQSIATMLKKPLEHVQKHPEYLHEALTGWVRVPGVTGEYLDHRAAWKAIDDSRGRTGRMRGVPGATWLALMSYPIWTTTAAGKKPRTSGWHLVGKGRRSIQELRLPLWVEPLGPLAIKALVEHPELDGDLDVPLNQKIRVLGIFHVCRARRAPSEHSAGLLIPAQR